MKLARTDLKGEKKITVIGSNGPFSRFSNRSQYTFYFSMLGFRVLFTNFNIVQDICYWELSIKLGKFVSE